MLRVAVRDRGAGLTDDSSTDFQPFYYYETGGLGMVSPSAARSSKLTVDVSGQRTTATGARRFTSRCRRRTAPVREALNDQSAIVFLVDDDASVRRALARLIKSAGYQVDTFASAREFLDRARPSEGRACLVLDVRMPQLSGIELQRELRAAGLILPIIFITRHGDIDECSGDEGRRRGFFAQARACRNSFARHRASARARIAGANGGRRA
jgi:CheY-like chemotaxis protein